MEYFLVVETQLNRTPSHILRNTSVPKQKRTANI